MSNKEESLYRLRVKETETKHVVYTGVSANTWLTPIGLTSYKPNKKIAGLAPTCQQTVQRRAKSAGAIMGRRHYETDRQFLSVDEGITGKSVFQKPKQEFLEEDFGHYPRYLFPKNKNYHVQFQVDFLKERPHTSYGDYRYGYARPDLHECEAFTVQPMQVNGSDGVEPKRCQSAAVPADYLTLKAIKQSLSKKLVDLDIPPQSDTQIEQDNELDPSINPVNRSSIVPRHRFEPRIRRTAWGPSLRPLMYDEDLANSSGCTDKNCTSCFRACLASDEYFEKTEAKMQQQLQQYQRKKVQAPKPKRPVKVIKRDFPDLQYLMLAKTNLENAKLS